MGSPFLFIQKRPGFLCRLFPLYKFRTMSCLYDSDSKPLPDAARITSLGRFLRSSSIDELPSLFNIFSGQMSFVGPRPLLPEYLPYYNSTQIRRHNVLPGLTGLAQVNGRNLLTWEEKFHYDVYYVDHQNFFLDCRILLLTFLKVILREGISHHGESTMPSFADPNSRQ